MAVAWTNLSGAALSRGTRRAARIGAAVVMALMASQGVCGAGACPSACDDGNACNGIETCDVESGQCRPGVLPSCDDADPCTVDSCDSQLGCLNVPFPGISRLTCALAGVPARLPEVLALLRTTAPGELGGARIKHRLVGDVLAIERAIDAFIRPIASPLDVVPRSCGTTCALRRRRRLCRPSHDVEGVVRSGVRAGTMATEPADALLAFVSPLLALCDPPPSVETITSRASRSGAAAS